jgi:hypothetical protein
VASIHADFFRENFRGLSTENDAETYDVILGNAPWDQDSETEHARAWAENRAHEWPIPNKAVGTLFLAKAATLAKHDGRVSMIQPASSLLFNRSGPATRFREKLFSAFKVEQIVNLSTLRFELFEDAVSPPCIVTIRPTPPDDTPLVYISPKQVKPAGGAEVTATQYTIVIEPHDISRIWPDEAIGQPLVWTALAWGGRRDLHLVQRLSRMSSLEKRVKSGIAICRNGIERGSKTIRHSEIIGRRILETRDFPEGTFLFLDPSDLPVNENPWTHRLTDLSAFSVPQVILKRSWTREAARFRAVKVVNNGSHPGVICSQNFVSVHVPPENADLTDAAVLVYNSKLAVYFLLLTSGRIASYRPNAVVKDLLSVPLAPRVPELASVQDVDRVDELVHDAFAFRDAEWTLVEDLFRYTLPDFQGDETSPGRQPTTRVPRFTQPAKSEPHLAAYCRYFVRVLKAGFGQDKPVCATIFQDDAQSPLPVRLVAIHLDWPSDEQIVVESIDSAALCERLLELDQKLLTSGRPNRGGILYQRVAMVYSEFQHQRRSIPTVYIVKPDRIRYWTRSAALRDADEVAADVQLWRQRARPVSRGRK